MNYLILIYVSGFIIYAIKSLYSFDCILRLKRESNKYQILTDRPDFHLYLIIKPFLWPYYFLAEKSPTERLSEFLFKHYGDDGHTYYGNHGLKNFCNDIFRGKNRYKNFKANKVVWAIDGCNSIRKDYLEMYGVGRKSLYAIIIYAQYKDTYLFRMIIWASEKPVSDTTHLVSRFDLDDCIKLDAKIFKEKLIEINSKEAHKLINELNQKTDALTGL